MMPRPQPGDIIRGKYRIKRLIGDGGMGSVYEATHEVLGTPVALKFLHPELAKRPGLVSRFLQEAKVSASIQSPHVTRVTDVDKTENGAAFIVMELLQGESLQDLLDRRRKLSRDEAIDYSLQILSGLEAAHALGVVHRDLKPDNVFVTQTSGGPLLRLLDFGIAKLRETNEFKKGLTRPGAMMGTPEYMAPEQAYAADQVDHRADIYSLGAMLYEMLSGNRPTSGEETHEILSQITLGKIKRITQHDPSIPEALAQVVHQAIALKPEERFHSVTEMRLALATYAGELSYAGRLAATPAPTTGYPTNLTPAAPATLSRVSKTLPPEAESHTENQLAPRQHQTPLLVDQQTEKGGTQEVPPQLVQEQISLTGYQTAVHQQPQASQYSTHLPQGTQFPQGGPGRPPMASPFHGVPPAHIPPANPGYYASAHTAPKRSGGKGWLWLSLTILSGLAITSLVIFAINQGSDSTPTPPLPIFEQPNTTVTAETTSPTSPPAEISEVPQQPTATSTPTYRPPTQPTTTGTAQPKADAGAPTVDAGAFPPFPLPLPSTLPPLPTEFPTIPGLPPLFPAPAPSQ